MKNGKTLVELAQEIQRQAEVMQDFVAPTENLSMEVTEPGELALTVGDQRFGITEIGHDTLAERIGIPARYYDRMREEYPELLVQNVNGWTRHRSNEGVQRMVRTLDGNARAVLSDRYNRLDNYSFLTSVFPAIQNAEVGQVQVQSSEITDRRMYLQMTFAGIEQEFELDRNGRKVGDVVRAGLILTNSEVGYGCREIRFLVYTLSCTNGMVVPRNLGGMKTRHVGGKLGTGEVFQLSDETREADDKAFALATRDIVRQMVSREHLQKIVAALQESNDRKMTGDPVEGVKALVNNFRLTKDEQSSVLRNLIQGGDLSQYGILNAVTKTANDLESYDRAVELEEIGGQILELPARQLRPILEARAA